MSQSTSTAVRDMDKENAAAIASAQMLAPLVNRNTIAAAVAVAATVALVRTPLHLHSLSAPALSAVYILPLLLVALAASFYLYYTNWLALPPTVHHRAWPASRLTPPEMPRASIPADHPAGRFTRAILSQPAFAALLRRPYAVTPWLFSGHLQTLYTVMASPATLRTPTVVYKRELLHVKALRAGLYDGQIALDWALSCSPHSAPSEGAIAQPAVETLRFRATDPTVVIVHGLAGGSGEHYVRGLVHHLSTSKARRFRCVVFCQRGCGNTELISPQAYCGAYTGDLHQALLHIHARLPASPLLLVGYSLGANVVTRYTGEHPDNTHLTACVAISNPWDCVHSCRQLERTWWMRATYSRTLAANLCTVFSKHTEAFAASATVHLPSVFRARTLRDFDTLCTSAAFNYPTVDDYYRDASSSAFVSRLRTPCLFVSCLDDPICDGGGIPVDECVANECTLLLTVAGGGHSMCLYEGWHADSYCVRVVRTYAESLMDALDAKAGGGGAADEKSAADGEWVAQPPPMLPAEKGEVVPDGLVAPEGLDNDELQLHASHSPAPSAPQPTFDLPNAGAHPTSVTSATAQASVAGATLTPNPSLSAVQQPTANIAASEKQPATEAEADSSAPKKVRRKVAKGSAAGRKALTASAEQTDAASSSPAAAVAVAAAMDETLDLLISFTRRARLLVQGVNSDMQL